MTEIAQERSTIGLMAQAIGERRSLVGRLTLKAPLLGLVLAACTPDPKVLSLPIEQSAPECDKSQTLFVFSQEHILKAGEAESDIDAFAFLKEKIERKIAEGVGVGLIREVREDYYVKTLNEAKTFEDLMALSAALDIYVFRLNEERLVNSISLPEIKGWNHLNEGEQRGVLFWAIAEAGLVGKCLDEQSAQHLKLWIEVGIENAQSEKNMRIKGGDPVVTFSEFQEG